MCGIAGFIHNSRAVDRNVIERVTASLFHRGPDQQNVFVSPEVCLGAVRLKVVDPSGGDQPFMSADRQTVVVFNGEIYNHHELRRELQARGREFRSQCDTEVLLHAFGEWGTGCFARLRGMFACAIWSERDKRLVLARDRMGIKPLYVCRRGRELYFGSELKAILEHPHIPRVLDTDALQDFLSMNYVPGPRTLIRGIEKLPPAHFLAYHQGLVSVEPYWQLDSSVRPISAADAERELDHLLRSSVREHLAADVPLGIWASGGLDSSAILHYAAELSPSRLKTFSVAFTAGCCDERRYFREIARTYSTEHHELELGPTADLAATVEDFAYFSDEPGADAGALPVWHLAKLSASHVIVALSGDGGDELFGGYATYRADQISRALRMVPRIFRRGALRSAHRCWPVSNRKIGFEYKFKRLLEGSLLPPDEAHLFWNGAFSKAQRTLLTGSCGPDPDRLFNSVPGPKEIGRLNRYMLLDQQYYLPDNILYKVDRMSMAHALEVRPPLLDHRIVEFAASLPQNLKIRGFTQKYLLKRVMRDRLPASVLGRSKAGFDIPAHDWFRGVLRPLLLDTLTESAVENTGLFNFGATETLIRDHMERRINVGFHLWGLLTLFLWLKRWNIEVAQPEQIKRTASSSVFATIS